MNLKHLTDKVLLTDTKKLAATYRKVTAELLHHIREIERRKLFSELGYPSLFSYVVQELGFSDSSAIRRIKAARMLEEIPEIEEKIESGELNISNIAKASDTFKQENITDKSFKKEILASIENTSARTCEKTLLEIINPEKQTKPLPRLNIILTEEELSLYDELRGLLAHSPDFWKRVFTIAVEDIKTQKFKLKALKMQTSDNPRYVPSLIKKEVYQRDQKCQLCGSIYGLEFDHITPFAHGGKTTKDNLRLLCRNCNQRQRIKQRL
ncbi:HNH endonuclease [Peredibacter starrii]|uniref:HNH endonuclease signature motif containing protein n=1 Tax=Peredibacter starrii TaxID=28202 RepID=A0AAX4HV89_9BACT|nr:HNH endonuclease signature motif containing protein [Peredibacter starrii]WPU67100.1 HNH endonuclease signature motif containing protein [Peredibacter starrii]